MDVLTTVLTFSIIISMTLTGQSFFGRNLFQTQTEESGQSASYRPIPKKMVVGLTEEGQAFVGKDNISEAVLTKQVTDFLTQNPEGVVMLKADRNLDFKQAGDLLRELRLIGGDRVLLGIDQAS
jgi:biopolymer transport protein ExbD